MRVKLSHVDASQEVLLVALDDFSTWDDASSLSLLELPLDTPYTTMSMKLQQNEKLGCDEPGL